MDQIELRRRVLRGEALVPFDEAFQILRARPHGHVATVVGTMRKLGIAEILGVEEADADELYRALD